MPRIRRDRLRRIAAAGAGAAALVTVLAACSKPTPNVTVQSGSTSTVVKPQTYCFDAVKTHCHFDGKSIGSLKVAAGSTVLVDVPREVETKGWQVRSLVSVGANTFKPVGGALTSSQGIVHDSHSVRLSVPQGLGTYYLVVTQQTGAIGSWITRITVQR